MTNVSKRLADAVRVIELTETDILKQLRNSVKSNMPDFRLEYSNKDDRRAAEGDAARLRTRYTPAAGEIDAADEALLWILLETLEWNERLALMIVSVHWRDNTKYLPWKRKIMPDLVIRGWPIGTSIRTAKRRYQSGIKKIEEFIGENQCQIKL